jgi:hypothetical protein
MIGEINKLELNNSITVMCELRATGVNAHTSLFSPFTNNMYTNIPRMITLHITEYIFGQIQVHPVKRWHFVLYRTCIDATLLQLQWYVVWTNRCFSHGYIYLSSRPIADIILQYYKYKKRAPNLNTFKIINYRLNVDHTRPLLNRNHFKWIQQYWSVLNFTWKLKIQVPRFSYIWQLK